MAVKGFFPRITVRFVIASIISFAIIIFVVNLLPEQFRKWFMVR